MLVKTEKKKFAFIQHLNVHNIAAVKTAKRKLYTIILDHWRNAFWRWEYLQLTLGGMFVFGQLYFGLRASYFTITFPAQGTTVKPQSMGLRDQDHGLNDLGFKFHRTILPDTPNGCPCHISGMKFLNFSRAYLPKVHLKIYFLNLHTFCPRSYQ